MSRSRRKTPITGVTTVRSEKQDKKEWHRRFRHGERMRLERDREALPLDKNSYVTTWHLGKDGKAYRDRADVTPAIMRK
jgi:hypothetical protein